MLADIHGRFPLGCQSLGFLLKIPNFNALLGHPLAISQVKGLSFYIGGDSKARYRCKI